MVGGRSCLSTGPDSVYDQQVARGLEESSDVMCVQTDLVSCIKAAKDKEPNDDLAGADVPINAR